MKSQTCIALRALLVTWAFCSRQGRAVPRSLSGTGPSSNIGGQSPRRRPYGSPRGVSGLRVDIRGGAVYGGGMAQVARRQSVGSTDWRGSAATSLTGMGEALPNRHRLCAGGPYYGGRFGVAQGLLIRRFTLRSSVGRVISQRPRVLYIQKICTRSGY